MGRPNYSISQCINGDRYCGKADLDGVTVTARASTVEKCRERLTRLLDTHGMVYVGKKPCGCIEEIVLDSDSPELIGKMAIEGLVVSRQHGPATFERCEEHK